jgi:hypothetical protein
MTWWQRLSASRAPDEIIGGADAPYLRRWFVIPKNRWLGIMLHEFRRSDDDRALHDHPWPSLSILLYGHYREWSFADPAKPLKGFAKHDRQAGDWVPRSARHAHRVELPEGRPCWTLFITGPRLRAWGFHCPNGWIPWERFTNPADGGATVGKGCAG